MEDTTDAWLSTEQAGREVGMSSEWIRRQITAGRLSAFVFVTGNRRTFRIARRDWSAFLSAYRGRADDPRFTDESSVLPD
jgi:hypothetical protein